MGTILNGVNIPITEGVDGDFYIRTTTKTIYGPKTGGIWGLGTKIIGPSGPVGSAGVPGPIGVQGVQGIPGQLGLPGNYILNGTVNPTFEGNDGDFYINTDAGELWGPKNGTWNSLLFLGEPGGGGGGGAGTFVIKTVSVNFDYTDGPGFFPINSIPNNSKVMSCTVIVTTVFNGTAPTLEIGNMINTSGIQPNNLNDLSITDVYYNRTYFDVGVSGILRGDLTLAGATQGNGTIVIEYFEI